MVGTPVENTLQKHSRLYTTEQDLEVENIACIMQIVQKYKPATGESTSLAA